jgi:uncharacterized protein YjiS (DUF1127 family)
MTIGSHVDRGDPAFPKSKATSLIGRACKDLSRAVGRWRSRNRLRADLDQLLQTDPRLIEDIGLDPNAVRRDIIKPYWHF